MGGEVTGTGLLYLLDTAGNSLQAVTQERDALAQQVEQLTAALQALNEQLSQPPAEPV